MHLAYPAVLAALLFCVGLYGVLARRNAILVLMSVELMLNAVNLNLVAFDVWLRDTLHSGQALTLFIITIAAAEIGLGLAIVLLVFRNRGTSDIDRLTRHSPSRPRDPDDPDDAADAPATGGRRREGRGHRVTLTALAVARPPPALPRRGRRTAARPRARPASSARWPSCPPSPSFVLAVVVAARQGGGAAHRRRAPS